MGTFRTIGEDRPLRVVQVGAGEMGRAWLRTIADSPDVELVGLVELDLERARRALSEEGAPPVTVGADVVAVARETGADAVVNVTVPGAHLAVNRAALRAGYPVLCEKPAAPTVAEAMLQAATAAEAGELLMISQSRRYFGGFRELVRQVAGLGGIGTVTTEFFKAPRFDGFRAEMPHVLLVDMAVHQFDAARLLIGGEPVAVYCEEHDAGWSTYRGAASAVAVFEFTGGARYVFAGSWSEPGLETSWNGSWRVSAEHGTAVWDGEGAPVVHRPDASEPFVAEHSPIPEQTAGSLAEFVASLRTGRRPNGWADDNLRSLAMVEAAVASAQAHARVPMSDVFERARAHAMASADSPEIAERVKGLPG